MKCLYDELLRRLHDRLPNARVVIVATFASPLVLTRGRFIARALGLEKLRAYSVPVVLTIPWGLVVGPVPSIPIPTKVTVQVCEPMRWSHLGAAEAEDPAVLQRCYDEIQSVMQRTLGELAREHPHPVLTRVIGLVQGVRREPAGCDVSC